MTTETKEEIYIPPNCQTLAAQQVDPQIRIGLQGAPGCGKTWAALTFPNPIVLNLDRGLGAHVGRQDVIDVPVYDPTFCDKIKPRNGQATPPNRKDATALWLFNVAPKLLPTQTLVVDGLTNLESAFETQFKLDDEPNSNGVYDKFKPWREKIEYYGEICDYLLALKCNVVLICHETADRDKLGELNGKKKPLLSGQFADKLVGKFTDFFRCHAFSKPKEDTMEKALKLFGVTKEVMKEWIASSSNDTLYLWETQSSDEFNGKASSLVGAPRFILANYNSIVKYRRKQTT